MLQLLRVLLCWGVEEGLLLLLLLLLLGVRHARHYEVGSHGCGGDVMMSRIDCRGFIAGAPDVAGQKGHDEAEADAMRRAAGGGEARQPETVGVKDNGAGGKRKAQGGWIPKRERELQQGRHRAMSRGKKGQRIAPVLPRRSGGGGGGGRVVGEKEKVQKFGWGRGREIGERSSEDGASVGKDTTASRKVDGSGEREAREARGTSRNPLGNQRDGTEGSREGEEAAWAGRDAALRTHSNWMMLVFDRVQLLLVLLGLLVVLAARHTAEGECARSEVRVVERNGGHDAGAVRVQWVQRDGLGARVSGRRRAGGHFRDFGGGASGRGLSKSQSMDLQLAHV